MVLVVEVGGYIFSYKLTLYLTMERRKKDFEVYQMVKGSTAVCSMQKKSSIEAGFDFPLEGTHLSLPQTFRSN